MEIARHRLTTYTELNEVLVQRTGLPGFDFSRAADRSAMGHLLGLVADRTFAESGLLISALVRYMYENGPGSGFYGLASDDEHRLLSKTATALERMEFWACTYARCKNTTASSCGHAQASRTISPAITADPRPGRL